MCHLFLILSEGCLVRFSFIAELALQAAGPTPPVLTASAVRPTSPSPGVSSLP